MPLALFRRATPAPLPRTEALAPIHLADGGTIPVTLKREPRASRLAIRVAAHAEAVMLVVPTGTATRRALAFLESRRDWIIAQWASLPAPIRFQHEAVIPVLGRDRRLLALGPGRGRQPVFRLTDEAIEVTGDAVHLARRTRHGLMALAKPMLAAKAEIQAAKLGRRIAKVSVGDAKARWGSCSGRGDLRFSWRLMLMPEPVVDYVVAHEVAHLAEMNHGPDFWRLVETLHPGHATERAWLRRHGAEIMRYG
jgi:predicted metal-dependent hydrolase